MDDDDPIDGATFDLVGSGLLTEEEAAAVRRSSGQAELTLSAVAGVVPPARLREVQGRLVAMRLGSPDGEGAGPTGRYRPMEVLGEGGMGRVLLSDDPRLGRKVAVKECKLDSPSAIERFVREARIMAQLEHPGILPIYDLGVGLDGRPYYAMRRVRGVTLRDAQAKAADTAGRMALLGNLVATCQAVGYAHARGVIHRDLKPDNVMIGRFGETVVLDWGLARADPSSEPGPHDSVVVQGGEGHTQTGAVMGTIAYMAPEQARGEPASAQSDVWSLAVMVWELAAGAHPLGDLRGTAALAFVREGALPPPPEEVPVELRAILKRALAPAPGDRYPDAAALAVDLEAWRTGGLVSAFRYAPTDHLRRMARRNRGAVWIAAVALAAVIAVAAGAFARVVAERDRALSAEASTSAALSEARAQGMRAAAERALSSGSPEEAIALFAGALDVGPDDEGLRARLESLLVEPVPRRARNVLAAVSSLGTAEDTLLVAAVERSAVYRVSTGGLRPLSSTEGRVPVGARLTSGGRVVGVYTRGAEAPEVWVHDSASGDRLARHPIPVPVVPGVVSVSPDGEVVVVKGEDRYLRALHVASGVWSGPMESIESAWPGALAWVGTERLVSVWSDENRVRLRDPTTGRVVAERSVTRPYLLAAGVQSVLVGGPEGLLVLDRDGNERWAAEFPEPAALGISEDGRTVAAVGPTGLVVYRDGVVVVENPDLGAPLVVAADGTHVAAVDGAFQVWHYDVGSLSLPTLLRGLTGRPNTLALLPSVVVAGGRDGSVLLWFDPGRDAAAAPTIGPAPHVLSVRSDGRRMASVPWAADEVGFGPTGVGPEVAVTVDPERFSCDFGWLPDSPDTLRLVASRRCSFEGHLHQRGATGPTLRVWDVREDGPNLVAELGDGNGDGHVVLSPDRRRVAAGLDGGCVGVWELPDGRALPQVCRGPPAALAWADGGRALALLLGGPGELLSWDVDSGRPRWGVHLTRGFGSVTASPDGRSLVMAGGAGGAFAVVSVADGSELAAGNLDGDTRMSPVWSPDGRSIVFALDAGAVQVVHLDGQAAAAVPIGDEVSALAWSSTGDRLAVGTWGGGVDIVAADGGEVLRAWKAPVAGAQVTALIWAAGDDRVHAALRDGWLVSLTAPRLRARDALLAAAAGVTNVRACSDRLGAVSWGVPWDLQPSMAATSCARASQMGVPGE